MQVAIAYDSLYSAVLSSPDTQPVRWISLCMATSLLQRTTIVPKILASYRWAQGCACLISRVL